MSLIMGTLKRISSGVSSRCALYSGYTSWRKVPPLGSKATAMCVGFSFCRISSKVFTNPKIADVFCFFEFMRGLWMRA